MPFLIFLVLCILWVLWVKFGPNHSDLIKIRFDYVGGKKAAYGKKKMIEEKARQIPGKIVGVKKVRESYYSRGRQRHRNICHLYLIVEFQNPDTFQTEEYTTKDSVNGNPFLYLKSLDVTVYYRDADHIFVSDFQRIKRLKDNIAYQVTGRVDGKDPGVLRYEEE